MLAERLGLPFFECFHSPYQKLQFFAERRVSVQFPSIPYGGSRWRHRT